MTKFFGSSTKVEKGEAYGWRTQISYMTPGGSLCPWASDGCRAVCLGTTSGHFQAVKGAARTAQVIRAERLKALLHEGGVSKAADAFILDLTRPRDGWDKTAIRVNGTSDLPALAEAVASKAAAAGITARFYDYTKSIRAALAWAAGRSSVHKTFSLSESNTKDAEKAIAAGVNVAAMVQDESAALRLAETLGASGVISGDDHDLRFLDPDLRGRGPGLVVYLTAKGGKARRDTSGFLVK